VVGVELIQTLSQFGSTGIIVGYLILREAAERKCRAAEIAARLEVDKADIASRLELSRTFTMLSMVIQGKHNV
jgi:hypothetical protein